jgi:hypothetical protein
VLGDQGGGGLLVVDRERDDPDAVVCQGLAGPLEGAQLRVAVGAPGAPVEENDGEVTGERVRDGDRVPVGGADRQPRERVAGLRRVNGVGSVVVDMRRTLTPSH